VAANGVTAGPRSGRGRWRIANCPHRADPGCHHRGAGVPQDTARFADVDRRPFDNGYRGSRFGHAGHAATAGGLTEIVYDDSLGSRTVFETRLRRLDDTSLGPYKAAAGRRPSATHTLCQLRTHAPQQTAYTGDADATAESHASPCNALSS